MKLKAIYDQLCHEAKRNGKSQAILRGGVKVVVTVATTANTVAIWRPKKKLGDTEIIVFRDHFGVPATAVRLPPKGQKVLDRDETKWYGIAWKWQ